jgi:hypothetical protein
MACQLAEPLIDLNYRILTISNIKLINQLLFHNNTYLYNYEIKGLIVSYLCAYIWFVANML